MRRLFYAVVAALLLAGCAGTKIDAQLAVENRENVWMFISENDDLAKEIPGEFDSEARQLRNAKALEVADRLVEKASAK